MAVFNSTLMGYYLLGVLTLAAIALALAVGVVVQAAASTRRVRLSRHQSRRRTHYGRAVLHH
jgi:uncharacterized protein (DUF58 family)